MESYGSRPTKVSAPRLGGLLAEAMKKKGIASARALAELSGVDKNTIGNWLKGDGSRSVNVASVEQVARVLGKTAEDLLGMPLDSPPQWSEWLETIERVDQLVKQLADLIEATRARDTARRS